MKVGSLFSGIGGLDLGLEQAGMEVVWQVEVDPYCQKVLAKHWPRVPRYGDIKEIDFTKLPAVDLICGGFPCQPVSCAGKRQGDKDERWLWPEFYRAVCEAKPRWVLVENVPGLLSADGGWLFGGILGDLARSGYDAEWDLLPAAAFGAPHLRYRLFLVGYSSGLGLQGKHGGRSRQVAKDRCQDVAHANGDNGNWRGRIMQMGRNGGTGKIKDFGKQYRTQWGAEPDVGRVAHGIPSRVDRLKCLGNAVVPQVAEWIGRRIMEAATP